MNNDFNINEQDQPQQPTIENTVKLLRLQRNHLNLQRLKQTQEEQLRDVQNSINEFKRDLDVLDYLKNNQII